MADETPTALRVGARHLLRKGHLSVEGVEVLARLEVTKFLGAHGRNASVGDVQTFLGQSDILKDLVTHSPDDWALFHQAFIAELRMPSSVRVAARYKDKKKVETSDGDEMIVYEYSDRQVKRRNHEKAKRLEKLSNSIGKLRKKVTSDLDSKDPDTRLTALAVALIDETFERVGNEGSAKDGHFGVTGWRVKHITFSDGKATLSYVGKSGVQQNKTVTNSKVLKRLKEAVKGKDPGDRILCDDDDCSVTADAVNAYLKPFKITAKDLRGLHANEEVRSRLRSVRKGKLPKDKKKREKKLKAEFAKALEGAAEAMGHEASTLKSQYLVPGLEDAYLKDGTVLDKLHKKGARYKGVPEGYRNATKTHAEKMDEGIEGLVRPSPSKKPPRHDLRDERVHIDQDVDEDAEQDKKDQSQNYKDIGASLVARVAYQYLLAKPSRRQRKKQEKKRSRPKTTPASKPSRSKKNTVWTTDTGETRAMNGEGVSQSFSSPEKAKAWLGGGGGDGAGKDPNSDSPDAAKEQVTKEQAAKEQTAKEQTAKKMEALGRVVDDLGGSLKKSVESFNGEQQEVAASTYEETLKGITDNPPTSAKDIAEMSGLAEATPGPGVINDPARLGAFLAKQQYSKKVLTNPMMAGGRSFSDDNEAGKTTAEQIRASQERAEQVYQQYTVMSPKQREEAFYDLNAEYLNATPGSPRHTELRGAVNGVAFSMAMAGDRVPYMANVPQSFGALGAALKKASPGSEKVLLESITSLPSQQSRKVISEAVKNLDEETLLGVAGGAAGPLGEWVQSLTSGSQKVYEEGRDGEEKVKYKKLTSKARREMVTLLQSRLVDTMTFVDLLVGEVLEASGGKATPKAVAGEITPLSSRLSVGMAGDPAKDAQKSRLEWLTQLHKKLKPKVDSANSQMSNLGGALWSILSDVVKAKSTEALDDGVHGPVAEAAGVARPSR